MGRMGFDLMITNSLFPMSPVLPHILWQLGMCKNLHYKVLKPVIQIYIGMLNFALIRFLSNNILLYHFDKNLIHAGQMF